MNRLLTTNLYAGPAFARLAGAAALLLGLVLPAVALADTTVEETRPLAADGNVRVENEFGDVEVYGWDRQEVRIVGDLSDDVRELEIRESGNGLRIRVDYYDRRNIDSADLELMVPEGASVEAHSVSGDIDIERLAGGLVEVRTVSGDIEVAATAGRLNLNTVSGDIDFSGSADRVSVETVSGEIDLTGVSGEIEASTVSGDVTLHGDTISNGEFEAVSGDVEITASLDDGGRLNVSSMSGDIDVYLPSDQEAEFFAQTFSGDISTAFGEVRSTSSRGPGKRLEHRAGDSGATVNLNSFSGDVTLRKR